VLLFAPLVSRSRGQALGSESSLDEGGVFECLKVEPPAGPQQLFSGLVGVPSGSAAAAAAAAPFQAAGLVPGSPPDVFIQMTASSREDGGGASCHSEGGSYMLPRPPPPHHHHHYHHRFHQQQPLQHRTSSLLQQASREEGLPEEQPAPGPALPELKAVASWLQRGFPFILILLAKVCVQHKLGTPAWPRELYIHIQGVYLSPD